jgi:hypothetical protein
MNDTSVVEFARRVERMCDFFIAKYTDETGRNGSDDLIALEKLKEEAANFQANPPGAVQVLEGFDNYMRGLP